MKGATTTPWSPPLMMRHRSDLPPVAPQPWSVLIPADSFYARLAQMRDVLVDDETYAVLYKDSPRGRPSLPPSLVVLTMLLQYHDDCSDAEAEMRVRFDLRWKHALGLALEDAGFDATVLCHFRHKLVEHGLERALFNRLVNAAREAGLLTKGAEQVVDSSHILGAAGVRDTYTLIRGGIKKLLRALGYHGLRPQEQGLAERLAAYLDPEAPAKPDVDWADAEARLAALRTLVTDARAALALVGPDTDNALAQEAAALLAKIVADDVQEGPAPGPKQPGRPRKASPAEETATADAQPHPGGETPELQLRHGVAPDRVLSVVDPEMRWGHKSSQQRWAGYKLHVAEELRSELVTDIGVRSAGEHDAVPVVEHVARQEEAVGLRPTAVLTDGAFGTADARADLGELGIEVVAKLRPLTDQQHLGKDEFVIDLAANDGQGSVTCPAGVTTTDRRMARDKWDRPVPLFRFPRDICAACSLRDHCLGGPVGRVAHPVRQPPGRQIQLHFHEAVLQQARAAQRTPEQRRALRDRLRPRAKVERKIAELMRRHGLRQGRYLGLLKTEFQAVMTATMVDAKRLLTLAAANPERERAIRQALAACSRAIRTRLVALHRCFVFAPARSAAIKSAAT
jgi:transposase